MEPRIQEILNKNRTLLMRNIISNEELFDRLREHKVFPENTIRDLQTYPSREERNAKMLELLHVRGMKALLAFCDALQMSGHNFLADFMREEASVAPSPLVDSADIVRRFPTLQKSLIKKERDALVAFLENKIRDAVLQQMWQKNYNEKEKVMDAKQKQIQQSLQFTHILHERDSLIAQLEEGFKLAARDAEEKGVQLSHFNKHIDDMKNRHKEDLEKQMNYNVANDRTLLRLTERQFETEKALEKMNLQMQQHIPETEVTQEAASPKWPPRASSPSVDLFEDENSALVKTQTTLKTLLDHVEQLSQVKEQYEIMQGERLFILSMIDTDPSSNFKDAVKDFVARTSDNVAAKQQEISKLEKAVVHLQETTVHVDEANALKAEIEKLRNDLNTKQERIYKLIEENDRLKRSIAAIRQRETNKKHQEPVTTKARPVTPRFQNYNGQASVSTPDGQTSDRSTLLTPSMKRSPYPNVKFDTSASFPPLGNQSHQQIKSHGTPRVPQPIGYQSAMKMTKITANPAQLVPPMTKTSTGKLGAGGNILQVNSMRNQRQVTQTSLGSFQNTYGQQQTVEMARKGSTYN